MLLDGEDVLTGGAGRLRQLRGTRMAMIFQEPMTALNPVLTVGDQIDEMLRIHTGLGAAERRAKSVEIMAAMRLPSRSASTEFIRTSSRAASGSASWSRPHGARPGSPDRGRADHRPRRHHASADPALIKDLQHRRGTGVLFITHDFGVVAEIADRVAVMQHGRIVEQGTAADVLRRPQHDYTRMLIAAVPSLTPPPRPRIEGPIALQAVGLAKTYGHAGLFKRGRVVRAADDVNLQVRRGETLGIVGESGSGKTTVARCIARLVTPTAGAIRLGAVDIAGLPERQLRPHRRRVQIVFQDPYRSLNPRRTIGSSIVEGTVNFGLSARGADSGRGR